MELDTLRNAVHLYIQFDAAFGNVLHCAYVEYREVWISTGCSGISSLIHVVCFVAFEPSLPFEVARLLGSTITVAP
jgi:hypothetical protein